MKRLNKEQIAELKKLHKTGMTKKNISKETGMGYSTVCNYTTTLNKESYKKTHSINVSKESYMFVERLSQKHGITKHKAMDETIKLAKRKCWVNW